jgi:hypothetical protein
MKRVLRGGDEKMYKIESRSIDERYMYRGQRRGSARFDLFY